MSKPDALASWYILRRCHDNAKKLETRLNVAAGTSSICPQMGLDGKWQANLYDPDGTRVELMEFQPSVKPCCSTFTAASPAD